MHYKSAINRYSVFLLRSILILVALLLLSGNAVVAETDASSFRALFEETESRNKIMKAFEWIDNNVRKTDSTTKFFLFNQILDEAKERNDKLMMLIARHNIAYYQINDQNGGKVWEEVLSEVTEKSEHVDQMLWAVILHRNGMLYYHQKKEYAKGLGLLLQAHELFTKLGYENGRTGAYLFELAWVYYFLGNYQITIELLTPAQYYNDSSYTYERMQMLNTIGLCYRNLHKQDSAFSYFKKTLNEAEEHNDSAWIGIAAINLSKWYIKQGKFKEALPYAEIRYSTSRIKDSRIWRHDSCEALIVLAAIDSHFGNSKGALEKLSIAERALRSGDELVWWKLGFYDLNYQLYMNKGIIYKQLGDNKTSVISYLKAYHYKDSIEFVKKETQSQKVHTEIVAQQYLSKIKQLKDEKRISSQARNFSMLVLLLAGVWVFILYSRQRLKSRKDRQLFENSERLLNTEKLHAEEQLTDYMDLLQEKNKKLEEIQSELERLKELPSNSANSHAIESIEKLKNAVIITDDDWFRFRDLFENVHHGFFSRLKKQFPDITPAEMRLMALVKLNISTNNMAGVLGVSPETIRKTAYRFRKKMPSSMNKDLGEIAESV